MLYSEKNFNKIVQIIASAFDIASGNATVIIFLIEDIIKNDVFEERLTKMTFHHHLLQEDFMDLIPEDCSKRIQPLLKSALYNKLKEGFLAFYLPRIPLLYSYKLFKPPEHMGKDEVISKNEMKKVCAASGQYLMDNFQFKVEDKLGREMADNYFDIISQLESVSYSKFWVSDEKRFALRDKLNNDSDWLLSYDFYGNNGYGFYPYFYKEFDEEGFKKNFNHIYLTSMVLKEEFQLFFWAPLKMHLRDIL